jgi:hypothetical protein
MKSDEPRAMQEIHEIRERVYQKTKGLTPEQRAETTNRMARKLAEKYGLKINQKD